MDHVKRPGVFIFLKEKNNRNEQIKSAGGAFTDLILHDASLHNRHMKESCFSSETQNVNFKKSLISCLKIHIDHFTVNYRITTNDYRFVKNDHRYFPQK